MQQNVDGMGLCVEGLLHYFVSHTLHTAHSSTLHCRAGGCGCGSGCGAGSGAHARHFHVDLVALSELAVVTTAPRVKRAPFSDGCRVETTARDEADVLTAQSC